MTRHDEARGKMGKRKAKGRSSYGSLAAAVFVTGTGALLAASACGHTIVTTGGSAGSTTNASSSTGTGMMPPPTGPADKVDVLLMIDNSSSMADKQRLLATSVPALLNRLINPRCVDASGSGATSQPADPSAPCPSGQKRELTPVTDLNIGIVDSSLGGMGSDACPDNAAGYQNNDHGHLIARSASGQTMTYKGQGFLAWDAKNTRGGITNLTTLEAGIGDLVLGVGETGCGYEQPLEAIARFLADPAPYASLQKSGTNVMPTGTDTELLTQRAQFLRADSLLLVIALTDENDFSINFLGPENYLTWNSAPFYRASSACATNPADPCCYSCGLAPPAGCPAKSSDASCSQNGGLYTPQQDPINMKESRPKQHYGFDPNFPVARYVNALTQPSIDPKRPDLAVGAGATPVANPIFSDLSGSGAKVRDPGLVFFAGIVGVPYQKVAVDPNDLSKGLKTSAELNASGFFAADVGTPDKYVPPTDPIMQESTLKRAGVGPGSPNGGDRSLDPQSGVDIQYTCIFHLPVANPMGFDCEVPDSPDNPLCSPGAVEPQVNAKAYPGLRELSVVGGLGQQGIAASICPSNTTDPSMSTFAYQPAVDAIVERVKTRLGG